MPGKPFITEDFLLSNDKAAQLYNEFASDMPILDYHSHLPPADVADNRRFENLFEIWLAGDHYKWRAMRSNGEPERLCAGDADPRDKFAAWARTVPHTLRNPLYHWTHLELKRYFDIDELLGPDTAAAIWEKANSMLATDDFRTHGILERFNVAALCTTDDPVDDLEAHRRANRSDLKTKVFPTFRPDKAMALGDVNAWNEWVDRLAAASDVDIKNISDLIDALKKRHDFFHQMGCRLSDHGLECALADFPTDNEAASIFDKARSGAEVSGDEASRFGSYLMLQFGRPDADKGWTQQLHLGAMRNNNTRLFKALGPDTGFDSIGDFAQGRALSAYLDRLDSEDALPKTIIYNINPSDNYIIGTMIGNFQDGSIPGKIQLGSGWWFLDQKEAMEWQLNALSNLGLLSRFIGMLTDSRSFMSYPRHEYFRRVLCNLIGKDVEAGEIPDDDDLVGPMIRNICFENAKNYLGLEI